MVANTESSERGLPTVSSRTVGEVCRTTSIRRRIGASSATDSVTPAGAPPASRATTAASAAFATWCTPSTGSTSGIAVGAQLAPVSPRQRPANLEREDRARGVAAEPTHRDIGLRVSLGGHADHRTDPRDPRLRHQVPHVGIVPAHHQRGAGRQHVEEPRLGAEVVLGRAMKVEVLVGHEIGQRTELECESGDALQRDAVGGHLHHRRSDACVHHLTQGPVDRGRVRRRHPGVRHLTLGVARRGIRSRPPGHRSPRAPTAPAAQSRSCPGCR